MGAFKTSHPGKVQLDNNFELLPFTNRTVCVKQLYERKGDGNGAISRPKGHLEYNALLVECNCIRWASILMDLTYQFIAREVRTRGEPPYPIPTLRFTRVMVALVQDLPVSKAFLVEEWIDTDDGDNQFIKYLNNRVPHYISDSAPQARKAREITDFLIFAQHVQWQKSQYLAFASDYQGAGELLTDPQITSNPYVSLVLISSVHYTDIYQHPWQSIW
jgi:alpha-kinase family protein